MPRVAASSEAEAQVAARVDGLVATLGLESFRNKFVSELSTGSRRIVELGTLFAHQPAVLLLDEPSSGIAQKELEALVRIMRDLRSNLGCTFIVIDHDTAPLSALVDRLVAVHLGRVIADGARSHVLADRRVVDSFLGGTTPGDG